MNRTKSGKVILWTGGVGIYLAGRIVLLNFLKAFAFLGIAASFHFPLLSTLNQSFGFFFGLHL